MVSSRLKVLTIITVVRLIMPKRKRSSDYCNTHAKQQKERIAAETSNERRVRLSAVRRRGRTPSTLYRGASLYDCNYDYVNNHGLSIGGMSVECEHCGAMKFIAETSGMCCNNGKVLAYGVHLMAYYCILSTGQPTACSTIRFRSFNHNMVI